MLNDKKCTRLNIRDFVENNIDNTYKVQKAIDFCGQNGIEELFFEKSIYHFTKEMASEELCNISNHGYIGLKKIAFNLENIQNFTIDGNGSTFIFDDIMMPFSLQNCKNIKLKNFNIQSRHTLQLQGEVTEVGVNSFSVRINNDQPYYILNNNLYVGDEKEEAAICFNIIEVNKNFDFEKRGSDYLIDILGRKISFSQKNDNIVEVFGMDVLPRRGNIIIFMTRCRYTANIFINKCSNVMLENIVLYSGLGMGVIAQISENTTVDKLRTKCLPQRYYSINGDAIHFVHCRGKLQVRDCDFNYQLDDALNVHGIYTRITEKTEDSLVVKFMHHQAKGLDLYQAGSKISVVKRESLIPYKTAVIKSAEKINMDYTRLYLETNTEDIEIGDFVEDLFWVPDLVFENSSINDNRSRGILIGHGNSIVVRNNYFHSHGTSILLEGDEKPWYEAGAVMNLDIENNVFDRCKYTSNGEAVIEMIQRKKLEKDKCYHKNIRIKFNTFKNCGDMLLLANSVDQIEFLNNLIEGKNQEIAKFNNCKNVIKD